MIDRWRLLLWLTLIALLQLSIAEDCVKDIAEDICPQREGFDGDCESKCLQQFPLRISSGCFLRSSGTLLSFFGIRSFACRCSLPSSYCDATAVLNAFAPARLHFSLPAIQAHSTIERLNGEQSCPLSPSPFDLSCSSSFSSCGWLRSVGADWFSAREHGIMPFSPQESPTGDYLVAVSKEGFTSISIDTCPGLCSKEDVNVTVRVWRAPWVVVELCFKEEGQTMCAPVKTPNGRPTTEVMPQTNSFSFSFRFSNLTVGDAVLIDDLSTIFEPCPLAQRMRNTALSSFPSPVPSPLSQVENSPFRASMQPSKIGFQPMPPSPPSPPAPTFNAPQPLPTMQGFAPFPMSQQSGLVQQPQQPVAPTSIMAPLPFIPIAPPPMRGISRPIPISTTPPPFIDLPITPSHAVAHRILPPDQQSFIPIGGIPHSPHTPLIDTPTLPVEAPGKARFGAQTMGTEETRFPAQTGSVDSTAHVPIRTQEGIMMPEVRGKTVHTATSVRTSGVGSCKDGDCRPANLDRTCIGRAAHIKCQAKCRDQGNGGQTAKCVREREYPFSRRCVCLPRRSPPQGDHTNEVNEEENDSSSSSLRHLPSSIVVSTPPSIEEEPPHQPSSITDSEARFRSEGTSAENRKQRFRSSHELAIPSPTSVEEILSLNEEDSTTPDQSLETARSNLIETTVTCATEGDCSEQCEEDSTPQCRDGECVCSQCAKHVCDFEKRGECGWSDLRTLSAQFNNISVAAKKGQDNRYGLSRMAPRSYSGLLRRAPISGPISLSVDLFPSHNLDVKICVHTLQTCQSQRVEARAWNRVTAKIRMKSTDKLFLLFYNKATIEKTIAIDNILLESGDCQSIPAKAVRRRRV